LDQDQYQSEKQDLDLYQSEKQDPDLHQKCLDTQHCFWIRIPKKNTDPDPAACEFVMRAKKPRLKKKKKITSK
jgi:hypothetical protein